MVRAWHVSSASRTPPRPRLELARALALSCLILAGGSVATSATTGCERHAVDVEAPSAGRPLTAEERRELQRVADAAFREARAHLEGLPVRLTLLVQWGKDVIPETGDNGAAGYPANIGWTVDPDRDVLATIRTQLRPTLLHELHHLARAGRVQTVTLLDHVVTEGLAIAFERDVAHVAVPWGEPPPAADATAWTRELLAQPERALREPWMLRHPDGRRWIGMRVGTLLVDHATRASGKSPAAMVFTPTSEVLRLAGAAPRAGAAPDDPSNQW